MKKRNNPLPLLNGVKPSYLVLPHEKQFYGLPLLHFLCIRFPFVGADDWRRRLNSGFVVGSDGAALDEHIDEHLIVVDKPHFLPVIPSGRFLRETLLTRLRLRPELQHLNVEDITPLHRLDKDTAGVMLLSHNPATRGAYQTMFQNKTVWKTYEALAPTRTDLPYPIDVVSRLVRGEKFFTTQEAEGEPNAHTTVELIENRGEFSLYRLTPHTGKKHQLRVHMMGLGMPLLNDALYPVPSEAGSEDYRKPLKLLAKKIAFADPLSGRERVFCSRFCL